MRLSKLQYKDLCAIVSEKTGVDQETCEKVCHEFVGSFVKGLTEYSYVSFDDHGYLSVVKYKSRDRILRDTIYHCPDRYHIKFNMSSKIEKMLREAFELDEDDYT